MPRIPQRRSAPRARAVRERRGREALADRVVHLIGTSSHMGFARLQPGEPVRDLFARSAAARELAIKTYQPRAWGEPSAFRELEVAASACSQCGRMALVRHVDSARWICVACGGRAS